MRSVRLYVLLISALAVGVLALGSWDVIGDQAAHWNVLAALFVLGSVSEAWSFRLRVGRSETQSSVAFIPFIASIILLDGGWAASVAAVSMFVVELFVRKKPPIRVVFNAAQMALSIGLASLVYSSFGGRPSLSEFAFAPVPMAAATLTYLFINSFAVSGAVALGEGLPLGQTWSRIAGGSWVYDVFSAPLGALLAFLYIQWQLLGILLLILPIYFVRHLYHVSMQLEQVNKDLLELMVKAIEARDPYTSGHSQRVAELAAQIAQELSLGSKITEQIRTSALLHDVGKIHEEYAPLLRKEGKLDQTEKALMQTHATRSADLASTISAFRGAIADAIRHHHENFDGTGYPLGLAGRAIPVGSRIIMLADTMDAMTTDRPYRRALTIDRVTAELKKYSGKQFDPALVDVVLKSSRIRTLMAQRAPQSQPDTHVPPSWASRPWEDSVSV